MNTYTAAILNESIPKRNTSSRAKWVESINRSN